MRSLDAIQGPEAPFLISGGGITCKAPFYMRSDRPIKLQTVVTEANVMVIDVLMAASTAFVYCLGIDSVSIAFESGFCQVTVAA